MVEKTKIHLKNKTLVFEIKDFGSSDIDVEDLLQVDTFNLLVDMVTWPVYFNRISNIKAEIENLLREVQFDFQVFEAQKYEEYKKKLIGDGEKATETAIDMAIKRDPGYKVKKFEVFEVQRQVDIVDGLYWAAKDKSKKLDIVSTKVKPEEFEKDILEGEINGVIIRSFRNDFVDKH